MFFKISIKETNELFHRFSAPFKEGVGDLISPFVQFFSRSPILFLPLAIYLFKIMVAFLPILLPGRRLATAEFFSSFVEKFGVVYGILLPLILVRAWEQLDDLDRVFDKEADAVKTFYDEVFFLREKNKELAEKIASALRAYVFYVINNYWVETKEQTEVKIEGNQILEGIMKELKKLFRASGLRTKQEEIIIPKLMENLNNIIDIRGDRVAIASQRLFQSLHTVALIASIIFIIPFYYESFTSTSGILDNILTIFVTFLVVIIFIIIEDIDDPFEGTFKVDDDSWQRLLIEMDSPERKLELENLDQPARKEPATWRSREADKKKKAAKKAPVSKSRSQRSGI